MVFKFNISWFKMIAHVTYYVKVFQKFMVLQSVIFYFAMFLLWPIILSMYGIFKVYRTIVDIILKIKHGDRYGGLVSQSDAIYEGESLSRNIITVVAILKSEEELDILTFVKERVKEKVFARPYGDYMKLTSTLHWSMGYPYWVKNSYSADECVQPIPLPGSNTSLNEENFNYFLRNITNLPFPKNDTARWQLYVATSPLQTRESDGAYRYPVIIKCHHTIASGPSLIGFGIKTFAADQTENYYEKVLTRQFNIETRNITIWQRLKMISSYLYMLAKFPGWLLKMILLSRKEGNVLQRQVFCGENNSIWTSASNVPLIKAIKNRIPNTKFSDIIHTAVAASLTNFFERNSYNIPDTMSTVVPTVMKFSTNDGSEVAPLQNKTTVKILNLPTLKNQTLIELLENVKRSAVSTSEELKIFHTRIMYAAGVLPVRLIKLLSLFRNWTSIITNVPGLSKINLLNKLTVETIFALPPSLRGIGVSIAMVSYGKKLFLGLVVDKALISSSRETKQILNDILYYIKSLDEETRKNYS